MKRILLLVLLALTVASSAFAQTTYVKRVYRATCNYSHPLSTYDGCGEHTNAGWSARECAINDAMVECENDDNVNCSVIGVTYQARMSNEFVGYKYCQAKILVHGFGPR